MRSVFVVILLALLLSGILFLMLSDIRSFEPLSGAVELYCAGGQEEHAEKAAALLNESKLVEENFLTPFERSDTAPDVPVLRAQMLPDYENPFFKIKLMDTLKSQLPDVTGLKIIDYRESAGILRQFPRGLLWLSEILLFALLVILIVRKSIHFHSWFKEEQKHYYFEEVIRNKRDILLQKTAVILALLAPSLYLLKRIIGFQFEIPGELLPPRDIFDFAFYFEQAGSRIQMPSPDGAEFYRLLSRFEILSAVYAAAVIVLFLFLQSRIRKRSWKRWPGFDRALAPLDTPFSRIG